MSQLGIDGRIRCRSGVKRSTCNPFFRPFWPRRGSGPSSGVDGLIVTVKVLSFLVVNVRFRVESIVVGIVGRSGRKIVPRCKGIRPRWVWRWPWRARAPVFGLLGRRSLARTQKAPGKKNRESPVLLRGYERGASPLFPDAPSVGGPYLFQRPRDGPRNNPGKKSRALSRAPAGDWLKVFGGPAVGGPYVFRRRRDGPRNSPGKKSRELSRAPAGDWLKVFGGPSVRNSCFPEASARCPISLLWR